ncbi:MAG: hypothetical protein ABFD57_02310, partial [Smithella sp.]
GNAVPVYVVNMPGSIPGSVPGTPVPSAPGAPTGKPGKFGKVASVIGKASLSFGAGYAIGNNIVNPGINALTYNLTKGKSDSPGAWFYDLLHKQKNETPAKKTEVGGEITIKILQDGRAVLEGIKSKNPAVPLDVSTGLMMRGM